MAVVESWVSLGDFPDEIVANTATKVILGIDEVFHHATARKLGIEEKRLRYVTPQQTALIQTKTAGDTTNRYIDVELPAPRRAAA